VNKRENLKNGLLPHLNVFLTHGDLNGLLGFIRDNSNLPGPRANLELADVFAQVIADCTKIERDLLWKLCGSLVQYSPEDAPVNSPQEFIPFCGAVGIGKLGSLSDGKYIESLSELRRLSKDSRWRMREAVRMGLQSLLQEQPTETLQELQNWILAKNPLEMRAAVAAVSEPELLQDEKIAATAIQIHMEIFDQIHSFTNRKTEAFRTLRKTLGYTLSLVIVEIPEKGFELLDELMGSQDADLIWIAKNNLKKKRLIRMFPDQIRVRLGNI
jgi:hypothetical protein